MADKPLIYHDFVLELTDLQADGTFKVRVSGETPSGRTMRADEAGTSSYKPEDVKRLLGKLANRSILKPELVQLGQTLAGWLLPGKVRSYFDESLQFVEQKGDGLRLRLTIEPIKLSALPWEYAFVARTGGEPVPTDFLALRRSISLTRCENIGAALTPVTGKSKLRIVAALASPVPDPENPNKFPTLDVSADEKAIRAGIALVQSKTQSVEAEVITQATRTKLLEAVKGTEIFHFAGHGIFDGAELTPEGEFRKRGSIVLETADSEPDYFPNDQLAEVLGNAGVRLAILGACNSAARDEGGAWTGVAPALVREKVPAVVAMQYPILDSAAIQFMPFLYARIFQGYTLDEAVFEGREAIFTAVKDWAHERDWGVPVLYLGARDGVLFPEPAASAAGTTSPTIRVRQDLQTVEGKVIGAVINQVLQGDLDISQVINRVEKGGEVIGLQL
jgi:CHAT domain-containing protein